MNGPERIIQSSLAMAFVKAQKGFAPALKSSLNPHFKSKYVDLAGCVEAVIDSLNANGIALMQHTSESTDGVVVETVFLHESGETLNCGKLHVPAAKNDPQGYGSALTYARRYSLMAACGIAPEDDDGTAGTKAKQEKDQADKIRATQVAEAQMLERFRAKALLGTAALMAFKNLGKSELATKVWTANEASLKAAADQADLASTV